MLGKNAENIVTLLMSTIYFMNTNSNCEQKHVIKKNIFILLINLAKIISLALAVY